MHRPNLGIPVVERPEHRPDCHRVQQLILMSKHRPRSDNRRIRIRLTNNLLPLSLGSIKFGWRVMRRIKVRDVHQSRNLELSCNVGNRICSRNMYGPVIKVSNPPADFSAPSAGRRA